jgi:uncharacterized protein involved in exopolysaccharide biosynthesis
MMKIKELKDMPTISISAVANDAELAAKIVQTYLDEAQEFINANTMTIAKRNRIFIEERLAENNADLLKTGKDLSEFYQRNPITPRGGIDVSLDTDNSNKKSPLVIKAIPQKVYYEHMMAQREILRNVNGLLATQRELARLDEVKEGIAFQIVDAPQIPPIKNGPRRLLIVLLTSFVGFLFGMIYVSISRNWRHSNADISQNNGSNPMKASNC